MIKCCIFDLDGTLIDSLRDIANAANSTLASFGLPAHDVEKYKQFVGNGVVKLMERILPDEYRTDTYKEKILSVFSENYNRSCLDFTKPYNGIRETLTELKKQNIILAVASNKPDNLAKKIINNLLPDIFDDVFGKIADVPAKPSPDLCLRIMHNHNIEASACAFIGDSYIDVLTAINAKILPVGVTWGFRRRDELKNAGARYIINKPKELLNILKNRDV
ncbi:MAG: HAD family hydrolase [Prevotellaceae bacterium]|jgi:phosphoglycolate phosphatase|nr:HAD family hydrolase [Prevotellaceae bacterium]